MKTERSTRSVTRPYVFVERVWRSLEYEEVFLHAYKDLDEARAGIGRYFEFYNLVRPHHALGYQTPDAFYRGVTFSERSRAHYCFMS